MLPKLASFFWTGKMSWLHYLTLESFRRWNPDWVMRLYVMLHGCQRPACQKRECNACGYTGPDYIEHVDRLGIERVPWESPPIGFLSPAQACDLCEWQLLGQDGGFYSDMDILWLKPLEPLRQELGDVDAVFCLEKGLMAIGFVAASPRCKLFQNVHLAALASPPSGRYQHYGANNFYRMYPAYRQARQSPGTHAVLEMQRCYGSLRIATLPDTVVYPFDWREVEMIFERNCLISQASYGLHWFGGHWLAQYWNEQMTPDNWRQFRNTLTRELSKVIAPC